MRLSLLIKKVTLSLCAALCVYMGLYKLCYLATDGFSLLRVLYPLSFDETLKPPVISKEELKILKTQLSSPFYYLGSGGQCYVFISQDKSYVLKLLKFHHKKTPWYLPYIPCSSSYKSRWSEQKTKKRERMLRSFMICYRLLKEETGILYPHVGLTSHLNVKIECYDKLHNKFFVDADSTAFILQKKGVSTKQALKTLASHHQFSQSEKILDGLIDFMLKRSKLGLKDMDPNLCDNLGIIDGKAGQLDLGSMIEDPTQKLTFKYEKNLLLAAKPFHIFLQNYHPNLASFFWERCQEKLAKAKSEDIFQEGLAYDQIAPFQDKEGTAALDAVK